MKKITIIGAMLGLVLLASMFVSGVAITFPNPPTRPYNITIDTAGVPATLDPACAYDTASGEMIFNVYDTLVQMNGEHLDQYLGVLADSWYGLNITGQHNSQGLPWYWRYVFHLRNWANETFVDNYGHCYQVTAADVQYSFWREMVLDAAAGPQWMLYEPLLNDAAGPADMGNLSIEADVARIGHDIEESVGQNGTHVWFNIAFPAAYGPFMQILTQTWSAIMSKQWVHDVIIVGAGVNDFSGDWSLVHSGWTTDHTGWIDQHGIYTSSDGPADRAGHVMCGSGPFILTVYDTVLKYWTIDQNLNYWRGWPANYPTMARVSPAGCVSKVTEFFGKGWASRKADLLGGLCDFCAVPRANIGQVYKSSSPPFNPPTNYPVDGLRCIPALPALSLEAMFYTFNIDPTTLYGPINSPGVFTPTGVPSDFFSNPVWGIHIRKAFAYAIDYATYIQQAFYGEAVHIYTALIPGIPYYDPTITGSSVGGEGYDYEPAKVTSEFAAAAAAGAGIANGFNIKCLWNTGALARQTATNILAADLAAINPLYVVTSTEVDWDTLIATMTAHQAPIFMIGWLADYPDAHDFAQPFYATAGTYPYCQRYSNATIDADVNLGIATPDGPARQVVYSRIAREALEDCPNVALGQVRGRHFERDWTCGWFYNSIYPGGNYYTLWKWYYIPQVLNATIMGGVLQCQQPYAYNLPADVNYDGVVDMKDIGTAARSFGALAGPPLDPYWVFRVDTNNDRKIDMKDIGYIAKWFNPRVTETWSPSGMPGWILPGGGITVSPMPGVNLNFTSVTAAGYAAASKISTATVPLDNSVGPYYVISVTAGYPGNLTISIAYDATGIPPEREPNLHIAQYQGTQYQGTWIDMTTLYVDTVNHIIYGSIPHFSLIGIH